MSSPLGLHQPTLDVMAAAYAAVVLERQRTLGDMLTEPATLDVARGELTSGDRAFAATLLGYTKDGSPNWVWGWRYPGTGRDHPATSDLQILQDIGTRFDIPELVSPAVPLSRLSDGGLGASHTLAVVGCGLLGGRAYYVAEQDDAAVFALLVDDQIPAAAVDPERVPALLTAAVEAFPFDNRLTVETYFGVHSLPTVRTDRRLIADLGSGRRLVIEYDERGDLDAIGFA